MEVQDVKGGPKFLASEIPDAKTVDALFAEWNLTQSQASHPSQATSKAYDWDSSWNPSQDDIFTQLQPPKKKQKTEDVSMS